jgi:hypothetical protein
MGFKRLGIFATADEIAHIKHCQSMPLMAFSNPNYSTEGHPDKGKPVIPLCEAPIEAAHRSALAHGLEDFEGFYGIDLSNGEFIKPGSQSDGEK